MGKPDAASGYTAMAVGGSLILFEVVRIGCIALYQRKMRRDMVCLGIAMLFGGLILPLVLAPDIYVVHYMALNGVYYLVTHLAIFWFLMKKITLVSLRGKAWWQRTEVAYLFNGCLLTLILVDFAFRMQLIASPPSDWLMWFSRSNMTCGIIHLLISGASVSFIIESTFFSRFS